eukprot:EG_transcript_8821
MPAPPAVPWRPPPPPARPASPIDPTATLLRRLAATALGVLCLGLAAGGWPSVPVPGALSLAFPAVETLPLPRPMRSPSRRTSQTSLRSFPGPTSALPPTVRSLDRYLPQAPLTSVAADDPATHLTPQRSPPAAGAAAALGLLALAGWGVARALRLRSAAPPAAVALTAVAARHSHSPGAVARRGVLAVAGAVGLGRACAARGAELEAEWFPTRIQASAAPNPYSWPESGLLKEVTRLYQAVGEAENDEDAVQAWTFFINRFGGTEEPWTPDFISRALSRRGSAYLQAGLPRLALRDFNAAIKLAPWASDPVRRRADLMELRGRPDEALSDYAAILAGVPRDPDAWLTLARAAERLHRWPDATVHFEEQFVRAADLPTAGLVLALSSFQARNRRMAVRLLNDVLRRNPDDDDARAAYAVVLWMDAFYDEAGLNWQKVKDPRYQDPQWVRQQGLWPQGMLLGLNGLLNVMGKA